MTTVVFIEDRPTRAEAKPVPVTEFLHDLSHKAGELADDWLFNAVSEPVKRQMLAERGIAVAA